MAIEKQISFEKEKLFNKSSQGQFSPLRQKNETKITKTIDQQALESATLLKAAREIKSAVIIPDSNRSNIKPLRKSPSPNKSEKNMKNEQITGSIMKEERNGNETRNMAPRLPNYQTVQIVESRNGFVP